MSSPKNPASGAEEERVKIRISRLREQLQVSEGNLNTIVESGQHVDERIKEEERIVNLKYRIKRKEIALIDTKGEIFEAVHELQRLQSVIQDLQEKSDRLREKLLKMAERLKIPFTMRASQHFEDYQSARSTSQVTVKACALCNSNFRHMDIIVAPCKCTYHPWCVVMQSMLEDQCADKECKEKFTDNWMRSLGLDKTPGI